MFAVPYLTVPPPTDPRRVGPAATALALATRPERWRPLLEPGLRRRLLADTGEQQVWLLAWSPGQGIELHDHGSCSGAFAVAAGRLTEHVVTPGRELASELPAGRARVFGPRYRHGLVNTGDEPAVSVHVLRRG